MKQAWSVGAGASPKGRPTRNWSQRDTPQIFSSGQEERFQSHPRSAFLVNPPVKFSTVGWFFFFTPSPDKTVTTASHDKTSQSQRDPTPLKVTPVKVKPRTLPASHPPQTVTALYKPKQPQTNALQRFYISGWTVPKEAFRHFALLRLQPDARCCSQSDAVDGTDGLQPRWLPLNMESITPPFRMSPIPTRSWCVCVCEGGVNIPFTYLRVCFNHFKSHSRISPRNRSE